MLEKSNPFKAEILTPIKRVCVIHGKYEAKRMILPIINAKEIESGCPICEAEEAEKEKTILRNELNRSIGIPERFLDCTLDNFKTNESSHLEKAKEIASRFITSNSMKRNCIFLGPSGIGKTHLAISILKRLPIDGKRYYTNIIDILDSIKESYSKNRKFTEERTANIRTRFSYIDYLVIDNFEEFNPTKDNQKTLFSLLNSRYNLMKPTILCSTDIEDQLKIKLGYKLFNKLNEAGKTYTIDPSMLL